MKTSFPRIARFERVSKDEFVRMCDEHYLNEIYSKEEIDAAYDSIVIPKRHTKGSAGYDFYSPFNITLEPGKSMIIPTGIKCQIFDMGWTLIILPRSSVGNRWRIQFDDTVPLIDADYYSCADNQGHIYLQITNDIKYFNDKPQQYLEYPNERRNSRMGYYSHDPEAIAKITQGQRFCQGVFLPYGITINDNTTAERTGPSGSTGL